MTALPESPVDDRCVEVVVSHRVPVVRSGLVEMLSGQSGLRVRPSERVDADAWLAGDVIVTDSASALKMLASAASRTPHQAIEKVLIVASDGDREIARLRRFGAGGQATLATSLSGFVEGINALARGLSYRCPSIGGAEVIPDRAAVPRGGLASGSLRRIREHVEANLAGKLELETLAALVGLSECHFARAFKQSIGISPHRYITMRRIAVASERIIETERPFRDIGRAVGFVDPSHFTRAFVSEMAETPRAYRRRHR